MTFTVLRTRFTFTLSVSICICWGGFADFKNRIICSKTSLVWPWHHSERITGKRAAPSGSVYFLSVRNSSYAHIDSLFQCVERTFSVINSDFLTSYFVLSSCRTRTGDRTDGTGSKMAATDKSKKLSRWYFGGIGSAGAACCTHPLDLLKVKVQLKEEKMFTQIGFRKCYFPCRYTCKRSKRENCPSADWPWKLFVNKVCFHCTQEFRHLCVANCHIQPCDLEYMRYSFAYWWIIYRWRVWEAWHRI